MSDLAHVRGLIEHKVRLMLLGENDIQHTTARVFARVLARVFWITDGEATTLGDELHSAVELTPVMEKQLDDWMRDVLRSLMGENTPPQPAMFRRRLHAVLTRSDEYEI